MRQLHPTPRAEDTSERTANPARVLLLAYHFPPSTVVGALRWDKLARALTAAGYDVDVVTLEPAQLARSDESRLASLPRGIRVFAVPQHTPAALRLWNWLAAATKGLRARSSTSAAHVRAPTDTLPTGASPTTSTVPTRPSFGRALRRNINARLHVAQELDWAGRAARAGRALCRDHTFACVITSGPPHFAHHAGFLVSTATGVPHIADFRDPWRLAESPNPDHDAEYVRRTDVRYESRVVNNAAYIVTNTEAAAVAMRAVYSAFASKIVAIMNGSDPEDRHASPPRERFTLLYAGSLYLQRDPRVLFRACAPVIKALKLSPQQFAIQFLGPVDRYDGRPVPELAEDFGLRDHVIMSGLVSRADALAASAAATQLVCLPDGQRLTIPAKLFEYVQLDAWLLAFAEPGSAMAMALAGVDAADVVAPGDVEHAARCVRARWDAFAAGERPTAPGADGRFLRSAQAGKLLALLRSLSARV